ncbi:MAG: Maf family protein [Oscillospiraceae bacterium]|nr:Maf family protein [Oscillospiraceae bacterium]
MTQSNSHMRMILASASPRRAELLRRLNADFGIEASDADETWNTATDLKQFVMELASKKASIVAERHTDIRGMIVIGADTVVEAPNGECFGKPVDRRDAGRMLEVLSGKWHLVHTGVCVVCADSGLHLRDVETTKVKFRMIDSCMAERYLDTGEFSDKAGAYAVQGYGALLVEKICGCYFNVMGLPLVKLDDMLKACGHRFF